MRRIDVNSGEVAFCAEPAVLNTVVGVCVAVCIWDHKHQHGGMCHYVLPEATGKAGENPKNSAPGAISNLIERLLHCGSSVSDLRAKIVGGATIAAETTGGLPQVGAQNAEAAERLLAERGVQVVAQSVGGRHGRRVQFRPDSGALRFKVVVDRPRVERASVYPENDAVFEREAMKNWLVLLGSSTGGIETLETVIRRFPSVMPPIIITQHIKTKFSTSFARSLNGYVAAPVYEAQDGMEAEVGSIYVAPGDRQLKVVELVNQKIMLRVTDDPPVNGFAPSVDYLFNSAALVKRRRIVAALLTGMGVDGAKGLLNLRRSGHTTIAQDEESSVVYGMPRRAIELGAVSRGTPLRLVASRILTAIRGSKMPAWRMRQIQAG